jgi:signal peptidase I
MFWQLDLKLPNFLLAALLILPTTSGCFGRPIEARYIVSGSMTPTLQVNDRIIIRKYVNQSESPQRGDIVLFKMPDAARSIAPAIDTNLPFIFRVVGLPGETLEVKQGKVFINNQPLVEPYITEPPAYTLPPTKIPPDSFMMLGDNRNNAFDSHYWGAVPRDRLIGEAVSRFYPFNRMGSIK